MSNWFLIRTKPRQEIRATEHLQNQNFTVYCPWLTSKRAGKKTTIKEPLFPGYLFLKACSEPSLLYLKVRSTRGVVNFVTFGKNIAYVAQPIIQGIKDQELSMTTDYQQYKSGEVVELCDGPLKDLRAIYLCEKGPDRCVILLSLISRQQEIVVDNSQLKKLA